MARRSNWRRLAVPAGQLFPADLQDVPMDYDSYTKAGVAMGSGALADLQ